MIKEVGVENEYNLVLKCEIDVLGFASGFKVVVGNGVVVVSKLIKYICFMGAGFFAFYNKCQCIYRGTQFFCELHFFVKPETMKQSV